MAKIEYSNLDALRSVAILTVLVDHLVPTLHTQLGVDTPWLLAFTAHIGQAGVLAFFVHTSIVLMMSLDRLRQEGPGVTARFYVRRAFRIYPLAWFTIGLVLILGLPSNTWRDADPVTPAVIASNVLLVQNVWTKKQIIQPLWSLAYEMQMYLVLPALFALVRRPKGTALIFSLMLLAIAGGFLLAQKTGGRLNMVAYLPCFIAGVWCYGRLTKAAPHLPSAAWLPVVLGCVAAYAGVESAQLEPVYWHGWLYCALLAALIPLFANMPAGRVQWACHQLAKYSYGLYLLHVPVLYLVFKGLGVQHAAWGSLLYFCITLVVAIAAYHWLEEPLIEFGRRLTERRGRVTSALDASRNADSRGPGRNVDQHDGIGTHS